MDSAALIESAQAALATGDLHAATSHLRAAASAGPNPLAHQLLGGLLFFDDDLNGARREWELAFREWKDAAQPRRAALVAADLADLHWSGLGNPNTDKDGSPARDACWMKAVGVRNLATSTWR